MTFLALAAAVPDSVRSRSRAPEYRRRTRLQTKKLTKRQFSTRIIILEQRMMRPLELVWLGETDHQSIQIARGTGAPRPVPRREGCWMMPEVAFAPVAAPSDPLMASWPAMPLAVVVGAGGMGAAIARRLAQQHRLLLADLNSERLRAVATSLKDEGARVESSLARCASGWEPAREVLRVLDEPLRPDFPAALTQALGRQLSSIDSYQLSKLALVRLCRRRAGAWGARRARIVSLSPGLIATPMGALEYRNPAKYAPCLSVNSRDGFSATATRNASVDPGGIPPTPDSRGSYPRRRTGSARPRS